MNGRDGIIGGLVTLVVGVLACDSLALSTQFRGQLSGWTIAARVDDDWRNFAGLRYLPELTLEYAYKAGSGVDLEASLNGFGTYASETSEGRAEVELYRLKLRWATPQTETRLGLQQINFGPARLLRSLRWFDQLDQRDPLNLTDGVYALLFKYTALNNANLWLWGLYGNDAPKGSEEHPSVKDHPEFGGRLQYPVWRGELAATLYTRTVDASEFDGGDFRESRFALDGRWEAIVGMWCETLLQHQQSDYVAYPWTTMATLGLDYTFGIGNGLYVLAEHQVTLQSAAAFGFDEETHLSAFSVSYPLGLFDTLTAYSYYAWEPQAYSQHVSWQRSYDNLVINVSLFRYPDADGKRDESRRNTFRTGYGGQVMVVYYH